MGHVTTCEENLFHRNRNRKYCNNNNERGSAKLILSLREQVVQNESNWLRENPLDNFEVRFRLDEEDDNIGHVKNLQISFSRQGIN